MALERHGHREHADPDVALGEQPHEPPEADTGAVLVDRLDLHVARARHGRRADNLLEERLRLGVAVQDRPLAALLVVHDDLEREPGAAGPFRVGRPTTVTDQIAGIAHARASPSPRGRRTGNPTMALGSGSA